MGLDWGYVDGSWHRIRGTPNIPKPPVGLTPQIIGKNRYGAIEWAMYENFGDEQFRIGGGNTAAYRAGKEARWRSFTDEQKVALIEKAYRYGDVVADLVNAGNAVADSIEESALWVSPALLAANGIAGVTVQKDLVGRPQTRAQGALQLGLLAGGAVAGRGLGRAIEGQANDFAGLGNTGKRSEFLNFGPTTPGQLRWQGMRPRSNFYAGQPREAEVAGVGIPTRSTLQTAPPGTYKYVVDTEGNLHIDVAGSPNHSSLLSEYAEVYAAGNIQITASGKVNLNADSGHYMAEDPFLGAEDDAFRKAMEETIRDAGLTPGKISPSNDWSVFDEPAMQPQASP